MSKALSTLLLLSTLISCAQKPDNVDVTTSLSPTSKQTASKVATESTAETSTSFVKKISMSVKNSFTSETVATINVDKIQFAFDSYQLSNDAREELSDLATSLEVDSKASIVIAGHCDARGTKDYNLILGEQRAIAVKNFLLEKNISKSRIQTISYGEEKPLQSESSEKAYKTNRRAEIIVK